MLYSVLHAHMMLMALALLQVATSVELEINGRGTTRLMRSEARQLVTEAVRTVDEPDANELAWNISSVPALDAQTLDVASDDAANAVDQQNQEQQHIQGHLAKAKTDSVSTSQDRQGGDGETKSGDDTTEDDKAMGLMQAEIETLTREVTILKNAVRQLGGNITIDDNKIFSDVVKGQANGTVPSNEDIDT
eukprot:gnl/TRDRNA2_/TRDRNA2_168220_c0_seq7.p1 gnl/TRDRNA2_/TRDRNA2_168220_c0~~gnl/TRDRNA2_/TRDRNA2_168220_c0_seq7.p1  ORF type:complete len:191 (+),score=36.79 gnl/TRDRNA2_/TRDRNA2_168220_c0_seq7:68-640(+)